MDGQKWGIAAAANNNSLGSFELPPRRPRMAGKNNNASSAKISKPMVDSAETDRIASILGFGRDKSGGRRGNSTYSDEESF